MLFQCRASCISCGIVVFKNLFKLVALFAGNLSYQWFRDSQAMTYATLGELVLPHVALGDQGVYSCRVTSNFGGSILSDSCHVSSEHCCAHIKY